jgi:hypothetical protein
MLQLTAFPDATFCAPVMLSRPGRPRPRPRPRPTVPRPRPRAATGSRPRPTCPRPRPRPRPAVPRPFETKRVLVQGRTDQSRTYIQKIQNLCIKTMHGIIASSQRTVDGTPCKEFNQKLRTSDQQNKNSSLDLLRHIK